MEDDPYSKRIYQSRYGADAPINAKQYMAECMVARQAKANGKMLGTKFWTREPWRRDFLLQLRHVASLLKVFDLPVIRAVINGPGKRALSFGSKWLYPLMQAEQEKQERERLNRLEQTESAMPAPSPDEAAKLPEGPRPGFSRTKSVLQKLKELD